MGPSERSAKPTITAPWDQYDQHVGQVQPELVDSRLNFVVISAPKTGTTWLQDNLICHKDILVPTKESKYFCTFWQWYDINWLLATFAGGEDKCRGDVGGSYMLLPMPVIQKIYSLFPELKLLFVMRDPVERAWSHIRHDYRYRVSGFTDYRGSLEDLSASDIANDSWLDYYLAFGDYPASLERWLSAFPPDQFHVRFIEGIQAAPQRVLLEAFEHLGITPSVDLSDFPLGERVFPGLPVPMPIGLRAYLFHAIQPGLVRLDALLGKHFGLSVPAEWRQAPNESIPGDIARPPHFAPADDERLIQLLAQQLRHSHLPRLIEQDDQGYNVLFYRGRFHAVACDVGPLDLHACSDRELLRHREEGTYLVGESPIQIKQRINAAAALRHDSRKHDAVERS